MTKGTMLTVASLLTALLLLSLLAWGLPRYRIDRQDLRDQAALREAQWTKRIAVEDANASREPAVLKAEAEIARARGVAEVNRIIGDSLTGNEAYLRDLWIQGVQDESNSVVYVPTEAGLPILEAGRRPIAR